MRQLVWAVMAAAVLGASAPAHGQETMDDEQPRAERQAAKRPDLTASACTAREGLSLCVGKIARKVKARLPRPRTSFDRLTRVAGMFMGRVDAAEVGSMKFRFRLTLE